MPAAKTKLAKQSQKHFKWYMAIILVVLVAVAGILILRFSHASNVVIMQLACSNGKCYAYGSPNIPPGAELHTVAVFNDTPSCPTRLSWGFPTGSQTLKGPANGPVACVSP